MGTMLGYASMIQHDNLVAATYGRKAVGNDERGASFHQ